MQGEGREGHFHFVLSPLSTFEMPEYEGAKGATWKGAQEKNHLSQPRLVHPLNRLSGYVFSCDFFTRSGLKYRSSNFVAQILVVGKGV